MLRVFSCLFSLAAALTILSCDEGKPGSPSVPDSVSSMGRIAIRLTDDPLEDVQEVHVWITGFSSEPRGGVAIHFEKEIGDVELLSLRNRTIEVVNTEVPSGIYEYVGFAIDETRSYLVESGLRRPIAVADGNVRAAGPFVVSAGVTTILTLDFDAEASLARRSDGSWALKPVLIIEVTTS